MPSILRLESYGPLLLILREPAPVALRGLLLMQEQAAVEFGMSWKRLFANEHSLADGELPSARPREGSHGVNDQSSPWIGKTPPNPGSRGKGTESAGIWLETPWYWSEGRSL